LSLLKENPTAFADEYQNIENKTKEEWLNDLQDTQSKIFITIIDSKLVGMGKIKYYENLPNIPVLSKLGVLKNYQNRGVAKELVKARENWAQKQGAEKVRLYVFSDNIHALDYAKKNGYKVLEALKETLQKSDDSTKKVIILEKDIAYLAWCCG